MSNFVDILGFMKTAFLLESSLIMCILGRLKSNLLCIGDIQERI